MIENNHRGTDLPAGRGTQRGDHLSDGRYGVDGYNVNIFQRDERYNAITMSYLI
jgi:hypothetical protein